jgi:hypothetical protein
VPSPRIGLRYALDDDERTTIKASAGRFCRPHALGSLAFDGVSQRIDSSFDPLTGALLSTVTPSRHPPLDSACADGVALKWSTGFGPDSRRRPPSARQGRTCPQCRDARHRRRAA